MSHEQYPDDHRYAVQRARYLARDTDLSKDQATAVAYAERGYSVSGTSQHVSTSESTIKTYRERAMAMYGMEITETLLPEEDPPDYEIVDAGYHRSLHKVDQKKWVKLVDRHRDQLPQEWVNSVLEAAREDGLRPELLSHD